MISSLLIFTLIIIILTNSLIGFDCGGQHMNTTTISLLSAGACDLKIKSLIKKDVYIQLLQLSEYNSAEVMQCKVKIQRTVYHCEMHSHISSVRGGQAGYVEETHYERCRRMHLDGILNLGFGGDNIIAGLKVNRTDTYPVTIAGTLTTEGACTGVKYQDHFGSWENAVVQGTATITLKSSFVTSP